MTSFKILTNRLPVKWQADLRETLGEAATQAAPAADNKKAKDTAQEIVVTADGLQIVENLLRWIQRMNRQQQSNKQKSNKNVFPNQGISLAIERQDGNRINLTERNASVVKQFLSS
jgi:GAF domain-containing protein